MTESMPIAVTVEHAFAAAPEAVWVALSDPVTVGEALPGCTTLEPADGRDLPSGSLARLLAADEETRTARTVTSGERYDATVSASVRDIAIEIDADLAIAERDYPNMAVEGDIGGDDTGSTMDATLTVGERGDECLVTWHVEASVGGRPATDGRRAVESTVARVATDFCEAVDDRLAARGGPESERAVKDPDWRSH